MISNAVQKTDATMESYFKLQSPTEVTFISCLCVMTLALANFTIDD